METADQEIARLEAERHRYSETFSNTAETDAVTRSHLQEEMDRRTARIRKLQEQRPLGFLARWAMRAAAASAAWGFFQVGPWWARTLLGFLMLTLAFLSLG
ncbi:hypothetical protein PUR49_32535 [Streptomyces sp. BE147]|uniref:hypothetical protein n=1 Tax=Streptomyces sp. BE147 TaxID=3002524 RepID=UPI002E75D984|nr:hypothetical protein [Streptomyces sp. BE147]MEE1741200.1 hypothetical protein [Streptomyces sp. BE147]